MGSTLGKLFSVTTFGESHGEALGCVISNCPAGLELSEQDIQFELDRRRPGQSKISTPRSEPDTVKIVSGTFLGKTIGSPITMIVYNENAKEKDYSHFKDVYRPSHADFTYDARYGFRSYRGGGRASARSTIGVVAAGAIAKKILSEKAKIKICGFVSQVHTLKLGDNFQLPNIEKLQVDIEKNIVRCPDQELAAKIEKKIQKTRQENDSLGGIVDLLIEGVPPGIGNPVFDRLDALLSQAMMAIPASKGVQIGSGFGAVTMTGSEHNDLFTLKDGNIRTITNFSGGIQGGISNGEPIYLQVAFKPTATISKIQPSVNSKKEPIQLQVRGRHDPCVTPRAVPIVEAFAALVLVDQFLIARSVNYNDI